MTAATTALWRAGLRELWRQRWQSALTVLGIALGVCVVVAVDLANSSARRAFALSLQSVAGAATHRLVAGPAGIDQQLYVRLRTELGLAKAAPLISDQVSIGGRSFTLLGVDPVAELAMQRHAFSWQSEGEEGAAAVLPARLLRPGAVLMSTRAARALGLAPGDTVELLHRSTRQPVTLVALFDAPNPAASEGLLLADIAVAQPLLGRGESLDHIDLILSDAEQRRLSRWLPPQLELEASAARQHNLLQMSEAFHLNLSAMSLLALLIGALLIYNAMTVSVLRRRRSLGICRALGVTRGELLRQLLGEVALLATLGCALGSVAGLLLGQGLLQLVLRTVSELYYSLHVTAFWADPLSLLKGIALGLAAALLAAAAPAWEAARSAPVSVQQRVVVEQRQRARVGWRSLAGVMLLAVGLAWLELEGLVNGFVALTWMVLGYCLISVGLMSLGLALLSWLAAPLLGARGRLVVGGIGANLSRTAPAVTALCVAVAATIGVGVMIASFRHSVELWLQQSVAGDVYISVPGRASARAGPALPESLLNELRQLPGVAEAGRSRMLRVQTEFGSLRLLAVEAATHEAQTPRLPLLQALPGAARDFGRGAGLLISEPLAYHQGLAPGDPLRLLTDSGPLTLPVLGVFADYTSSQGLIALHWHLFQQLWADTGASGLMLLRTPDTAQQALLAAVHAVAAEYPGQWQVRSSAEIRAESLAMFDRTFVVTRVLRLLVVLVAFVGVLSALLSLQLERRRELATLRALGMTPGEVAALVLAQTALLGLIAGVLALPLGLGMSQLLVEVINRRAFGWSLQLLWPPSVLPEALALALLAALLAGLYPAWRAAAVAPARSLREE